MPRIFRLDREDNAFQRAEVLRRNRTKRHHYRECFVEGVGPLNRLLDGGWRVMSLWGSYEREPSRWAAEFIERSGSPLVYELPQQLMDRLSERDESTELVALAEIPDRDLEAVEMDGRGPVLVLDRPGSPGNLGALIRSADALGAVAVVVSGHGVDPYDPQTIRASRGSVFTLPVVAVRGPSHLGGWLAAQNPRPRVVGTDSGGDAVLFDVNLSDPLVLILGNEATGMSHGYGELCDVVASIPLSGSADSLNVACAGSIALYEVVRQRRKA
ncbi:MAG TPA: TrmH family RNA methyltransferase [Candidatus Dormibacteraeota bacterium]|nr:TrmH family RNA methyltransferase [Candidatus Dormibacteraeota bacterium]